MNKNFKQIRNTLVWLVAVTYRRESLAFHQRSLGRAVLNDDAELFYILLAVTMHPQCFVMQFLLPQWYEFHQNRHVPQYWLAAF